MLVWPFYRFFPFLEGFNVYDEEEHCNRFRMITDAMHVEGQVCVCVCVISVDV